MTGPDDTAPPPIPGGRRRWRKRWAVLLASPFVLVFLATLLVTAPFLLIRIPQLRTAALDLPLVAHALRSLGRLRIEHVDRLDPWGIRLRGVRFERLEEGAWVPWLRVAELESEFAPRELWHRNIDIDFVELDSVWIDLDRRPPPDPNAARTARRALRLPRIRCDRVELRGVDVRRDGSRWLAGDAVLEAITHESGRATARLQRVRALAPAESLDVLLSSPRVVGEESGRASIDSLSFDLEGASGVLGGELSSGGPDSLFRVEGWVSVDPLEPQRVPILRRRPIPFGARDRVTVGARFAVERAAKTPFQGLVVLDLSGRLFDTSVDTLAIVANGNRELAQLEQLFLRSERLLLEGDGSWVADGRRLEARLRYERLDLAGPVVARWRPGLPSSDLAGDLRAELRFGEGRPRIEADLESRPSVLSGRPLDAFALRARMADDRITIDTLRVGGDSLPVAQARGAIELGSRTLDVTVRLHDLALDPWVDPWLRPELGFPITGLARGGLTVGGSFRRPTLGGELEIFDGSLDEVSFAHLEAREIDGTLAPLRIATELSAVEVDIYGFDVDGLDARAVLADTIEAQAIVRRDSLRLEIDGRVLPTDPGAVLLDRIRLEPGGGQHVELAEPARIELRDGGASVASVHLRADAGELTGSAWIGRGGEGAGSEPFAFEARARGLDLGSVLGYFRLPADTLYGRLDFDARGEGRIGSPRYEVDLRSRGLWTYGWSWNDVRLRARAGEWEPGACGAWVDSLHARGSGYEGTLPSLVPEETGPARPDEPVLVEAYGLGVEVDRPWRETLLAAGDSLALILRRARLTGRLRTKDVPAAPFLAEVMASRARSTATPRFVTPLNPLTELIKIRRGEETSAQAYLPRGLGGRLGFELTLGGTGGRLQADLELEGEGLEMFEARADSVRLSLSHRDDLLTLSGLEWYVAGVHAHSEGYVPLRLAWGEAPRLLREPMRLEIELPSVDLALATLVTNLITDPSGELSGRVRIEGIYPDVRRFGDLELHRGAFRIPNREERFSEVEARLFFDRDTLKVPELTGRLNTAGTVSGHGHYLNQHAFDFWVQVRDAPINETGNYRFVASADLHAHPIADADSLRPLLEGEVRLKEGILTQDLSKQPPGGPRVLETPWLIDLTVQGTDDLRMTQPVMNVDLEMDQLRVGYRRPYWNLAGEIRVAGGRYRVFNKYFRVTGGRVTFQDVGTGLLPLLDIQAETDLADPQGGDRIIVYVNVSGSALRPEVALSSSDGRADSEIVELLTVGQLRGGQVGTFRSDDPTVAFASAELFGQVEQQILQRLPWFEQVRILDGLAEDTPWAVEVRFNVNRQLNVSYQQAIDAAAEREIGVRYRLSELLFLNAVVDQRSSSAAATTEETYSLDLRFRVEY